MHFDIPKLNGFAKMYYTQRGPLKRVFFKQQTLHKKCPNTELFLVLIFLYLEYSTNTGKYGPEITPYLDTFYAVQIFKTFVIHIQWLQRYTDNKFRDHLLSVYLYLENSSSHLPRKHFLVLSQKKKH